MAKREFLEIAGIFSCQSCKKEVKLARFYKEDLELTWLCSNNHMSKVSIAIKKGY